jgi:hypothetical protein
MPIPKPNPNEAQNDYVSRCMSAIGDEYDTNEQAVAVCISTYQRGEMSKLSGQNKVNAMLRFNHDFRGIKLADDGLEGICWEGYEAIGTKILDGREVPNCVPIKEEMQAVGKNINVFGIETEYFHMCPGAVALFEHLTTMEMDEDTKGMVRSAALIADRLFEIEEDVIEDRMADGSDLAQATQLVSDFKDLMKEIDQITGMEHDVQFMDGHIEVIKSYM